MTFEFPVRAGTCLLVGVALLIAACSRPGSTAGSSALKPIDQAALQTMVDTTAKELLIPGAMVLLRTPEGEFTVTYGTTLTRRYNSTPRRHPFPDRLQYQDDDGRGNRAARPGRQAQSRRSSLEVCPGCARRRQDHHRRTAEDAQRPLQLRRRPRVLGDPRPRPDQGLVPSRSAGDRVQAPALLPNRYGLPLFQRQLRTARPHCGKDRREAAGQLFPRPFVRTAGPEGHPAPRHHLEHPPRSLLARLLVRRLLL